MHIIAFICANGLGHFRRTIAILDHLAELSPNLEIEIVCSRWQVQAMEDFKHFRTLQQKKLTLHTETIEPGIIWSLDANIYRDGRLINWVDRISLIDNIRKADYVLSDNLSGILSMRSDTIMIGSFLWSDVLEAAHPHSSAVHEFVEHERALLALCRPPMLCVREVVMPSVVQYTDAIQLDWMCDDFVNVDKYSKRPFKIIGIIGGATNIANEILGWVIEVLMSEHRWCLALPKRYLSLDGLHQNSLVIPFEFTKADYLRCDLIIGRPGMGTVTDCLTYGIPLIAVHESGNIELEHIGRRIASLGFGLYLGAEVNKEALIDAVEIAIQPEILSKMHETISSLPRNGLHQAAVWLSTLMHGE